VHKEIGIIGSDAKQEGEGGQRKTNYRQVLKVPAIGFIDNRRKVDKIFVGAGEGQQTY
jgi:hypothetical protein